jgi:hypothetical protein
VHSALLVRATHVHIRVVTREHGCGSLAGGHRVEVEVLVLVFYKESKRYLGDLPFEMWAEFFKSWNMDI